MFLPLVSVVTLHISLLNRTKNFLFSKVIVGIFSLFGKKPAGQEAVTPDKSSAKKTKSRTSVNNAPDTIPSDEAFSNSIIAQKHKGRATERKIDAIEFEMTRDIGKAKSAHISTASINKVAKADVPVLLNDDDNELGFESTLALDVPNSDFLLNNIEFAAATLSPSESVPLLEEAAILFASDQREVAEQMLRGAIKDNNLGSAQQIAWFMLFDLYQISNKREQFDDLSLDYASQFEMSPPLWKDRSNQHEQTLNQNDLAVIPSVTFPVKLDASIVKTIENLSAMAIKSRAIKLDFTRVKSVDPIGCGLLLHALKSLKKSSHDLTLVGAADLANKIRAILSVGRRDETEAPWLVLLEILQLLQMEKDFEEVSIDYCVTFEVSPPSFEAPSNKVTTALAEIRLDDAEPESNAFLMPQVIEGQTEHLIARIFSHAEFHKFVILDCSQLERVEFGASAQLLSGLVPLAARKEVTIQFQEVNYLILNLFNAMGLKSVAAIFPRKQ
jgi:ABC-type transporter Mla MlaB component